MWRGILLFTFLIAPVTHAQTTGQQRAEAAGRSLIGSPAPGLLLKTIDGEAIDLSSLYGKKAVYLKFWATWCVPCHQQMPHFQHAFEGEGSDLVVIAVNVGFNDSVQEIRKYQRQVGISMPVVFDGDGHLAAAFHLRVTPQHIIIGRDGRIHYIGHLADEALDAALRTARMQPMTRQVGFATQSNDSAKHLDVGQKIPDASVQTLAGDAFHFSNPAFNGPTVLVFISPWCESYLANSRPQVSADCRAAREQVATLSGDGHAHWLGVASGLWAAPEDLEKYRSEYKVTIPLTLDETGRLFREFGVSDTPTVIILNAQKIIVRRIDPSDIASLEQVLRKL